LTSPCEHDLRTPLAKLRLGVETLADRSEPELRASMNRSIEEMDSIVGQYLDFARGDEAQPMTEGDLDALVGAIARGCADHGRALDLALGAPLGIRTGGDPDTVWVEVTDQGDGIAASDAEALKQPFRRAQTARSGAAGAGLGLAIVDRLVRAQSGRFELLANAPRGLCARITLMR